MVRTGYLFIVFAYASLFQAFIFFRAPFTSHRSPLSERLEQATPMLNGHFVKRALSWPCLQGGHYVSYLARRKMLG